ncbi:MAG: 4Fe-4S binding protein [Senegalimassilia anaerobia]
MDVDVTASPDHVECIRCGMCVNACPADAISYRFGMCMSCGHHAVDADRVRITDIDRKMEEPK